MEKILDVNDGLRLIQKTEGLTFGTDALLLAGYLRGKYSIGLEIGAGSGIISLLLLSRGKIDRIKALEVQEEYAELVRRNADLNGLSDKLEPLKADIRDYVYGGGEKFDVVFTNPAFFVFVNFSKLLFRNFNID